MYVCSYLLLALYITSCKCQKEKDLAQKEIHKLNTQLNMLI